MPSEPSVVYDAVVVGAGPAGSCCAAFLAREGWRVLLLDKASFPRDKICGDGVVGKSLEVLRALGWESAHGKTKPWKIYGVTVTSPADLTLKIPARKPAGMKPIGFCQRRSDFDHFLLRMVRKETEVREGTAATGLLRDGRSVIGLKTLDLATRREESVRSRLIIGADGSGGVVARQTLAADSFQPAHSGCAVRAYYRNVRGLGQNVEFNFTARLTPGYLWIFPLGGGEANVGLLVPAQRQRQARLRLFSLLSEEIRASPALAARFQGAERAGAVKGWILPYASAKRSLAGDGWLLLGDAASLVDPFTGEGIGNAMVSAQLAAAVASKALKARDCSHAFLSEYERLVAERLKAEVSQALSWRDLAAAPGAIDGFVARALADKELGSRLARGLRRT